MSVIQREVQDLAGQLGELKCFLVRDKARWSAEAAKVVEAAAAVAASAVGVRA